MIDYCRRSANPVGRLLLHLFKRTSDSERVRPDAICSALQLINFWQDVEVDYRKDARITSARTRWPASASPKGTLRTESATPWQSLMRFQVDRARKLILSGSELKKTLPGRVGLEIRACIQGGLRILEKIEHAGFYDVFRRRPKLRAYDWPLLLAKAL